MANKGTSYITNPSGIPATSANWDSERTLGEWFSREESRSVLAPYPTGDSEVDTQNIADSLSLAIATGRNLELRVGTYKVVPPSGNSSCPFLFDEDPSLEIEVYGQGRSTILEVEDNDSHGYSYAAVFGNTSGVYAGELSNYTRGGYGRIFFHDFSVKGGWATNSTGRYGYNLFGFAKLDDLRQERIYVTDWQNKFNRVTGCSNLVCMFNEISRCASDALRGQECSRAMVRFNKLRHCNDDAIAIHSSDNISAGIPGRYAIIIEGNILEDSESIIALGGKSCIVKNNIVARSRGTCITVVSTALFPEGKTTMSLVEISGNQILDPLVRLDETTGTFPSVTQTQHAITYGRNVLSSSESGVAVGYPTTSGAFEPPYGGDATTPAYMYNANWTTGAAGAASGVKITNNTIMRTLPSVDNWSDWGFGDYLGQTADFDPAVSDDNFMWAGIGVVGNIDGLLISGNTSRGMYQQGLRFDITSDSSEGAINNQHFKRVLVTGNDFTDQPIPIGTAVALSAQRFNWDITIDGNILDGDPYHKHPFRNADGSWQDMSSESLSSIPTGAQMRSVEGVKFRNNSIWNVYTPYNLSLTSSIDNSTGYTGAGNVVHCLPVSVNYSASNKGVAVPGYGAEFDHVIYDADPTSSGYGEFINNCKSVANAMPSSGTWVQGHVVLRGNYAGVAPRGWVRVTTGSGNVLDTDWVNIS